MAKQIGQYQILEQIARGGMGTVYRAVDAELERIVALKVLSPQLGADPDFVERFRREAITAANLHHRNIVTIYGIGIEEAQYSIAMEYVNGRDLHKIIRTEGRMDPERVGAILAQIAAALDYAHLLGVIHRDIKPGNILLDDRDEVKLVDFGIAKALGATTQLTASHMRMGTPQYTSPEQAEGALIDARTDIYSLGIVVYELLAGRVPFTAETTDAILYAHIHKPPPPLREQRQNIPPRLEQVVLKALAKKPQDRFNTAGEFARAYQGALGKEASKTLPSRKVGRRILPAIALILGASLIAYLGLRAVGAPPVAVPTAIATIISPSLSSARAPTAAMTPTSKAVRPAATRSLPSVIPTSMAATDTRIATSTLASPSARILPTSTLLPTWTPVVIPPTSTIAVKPQPPTTSPTSIKLPAAQPPRLAQPPDRDSRTGKVTFAWLPVGELPAGAAYEVVWWEEGAAPDTAKDIASATTGASQEIDLGSLGIRRIRWTVLVVQPSPYKRLITPGSGIAYTLNVCQMMEKTCTRTIQNDEGETVTESYACTEQVCP